MDVPVDNNACTSDVCNSGVPSNPLLPAGTSCGGTQVCDAQGTSYGPCMGQVLPQLETCNTPEDDDCDGSTNESGAGCVCPPNMMVSCYSGPPGTQGKGICKAGLALCNDQGTMVGASHRRKRMPPGRARRGCRTS